MTQEQRQGLETRIARWYHSDESDGKVYYKAIESFIEQEVEKAAFNAAREIIINKGYPASKYPELTDYNNRS